MRIETVFAQLYKIVGPYIVLRRFLRMLVKPEEYQIGQVKINEEISVSQTSYYEMRTKTRRRQDENKTKTHD